jgi:large subunit ribosomal protein L40e
MKILVRATESKVLELNATADSSIDSLKSQISDIEGIPCEIQRLVFNFRELENGSSVDLTGLEDGSIIDLELRLLGGAVSTDVPDHLKELAHKYRTYKMICRKCYARLPLNAHNCRKRKCGHCPNIRPKKKIKDKEGKK